MYEIALMDEVRHLLRHDPDWLYGVLVEAESFSTVSGIALGAALGLPQIAEVAWKIATDTMEDALPSNPARSFRLGYLMACGGNPDAIIGLCNVQDVVDQRRSTCSDKAEADRLKKLASDGIATALTQFSDCDKDITALRWFTLLKMLRYDPMQSLFSMVELCRQRRFPETQTYEASPRVEQWLKLVEPLVADTETLAFNPLYSVAMEVFFDCVGYKSVESSMAKLGMPLSDE